MEQSGPGGLSVPSSATGEISAGGRLEGLIAAIAQGDQRAFGALYDETSRLVYSLVLRMLANPADAEEVTLDVYSKVWRAAATYDSRRGTVLAWLVTLARSRAVDRIRSRDSRERREEVRDLPLDAAVSEPDPEQRAAFDQRRQQVNRALNQLPAEQRESIELAYFDGLTHTEISERLALPVGTVKTRIRLGMIKLRDALAVGQAGAA